VKSSYRIVLFSPDPFTEARLPVGALVQEAKGWRLVTATALPDERNLGGPKSAELLRRILRELAKAPTPGPSLGPHVVLGEARQVPEAVIDPRSWVRDSVLPSPSPRERGPIRDVEGLRYLREHGLAPLVRRNFDPETQWSGKAAERATGLKPVSQYVEHGRSLLLLEPLTARRARAVDDALDVSATLMAYRWALHRHRFDGLDLSLVTYVVPGGDPELRAEMLDRLDRDAYEVFDTELDEDRERFFRTVSKAGGQPALDTHKRAPKRSRARASK
jgi:hypothetical protein